MRKTYTLALNILACAALALPTVSLADGDTPEEQLAAASALFDAHKYAEAAQKLDAFLAENPKHAKAPVAAFVLGRSRTELKQYDKAIPAYEKAIAGKDPSVLKLAELGLGEAAMSTRQYEKALPALAAAVKESLSPQQSAAAWMWLGQANFELKHYMSAQDAYEKVTRDFPKGDFVDHAWYGAGLSALRQGKMDQAREDLQTVVDQFPRSDDRPDAMLTIAQMDLGAKRWEQARNRLQNLLQIGDLPKETRAATEDGLIQALLELGEYGSVIPRLQSAINRLPASDPQRFRACLSLGNAQYRQKQYSEALASYTEAASSTEDAVAAQGLYWAGNCDIALKRPADAAPIFTKLATRFPNSDLAAKALLKAGDAYTETRQTEAGSTSYRALLAKYPQAPEAQEARQALADAVNSITDPTQLAAALKNASPEARTGGTIRLARIYLQQKRFADAVPPLTDMLKANPPADRAAEANYLLGVAYDGLDRDAQAESVLSTAIRTGGSSDWVPDAQVRLAWIYLNLKNPAKAEAAATGALGGKLEPAEQQQARLALLQALLGQQKWDAALEATKPLMEGNPSPDVTAAVLFTQAWVAEKREKPDEAQPIWDRIASEFPKSSYASDALMRQGDARLKAEKYDEARDKYAALLVGFPKSLLAPEARFKLGSCLYNTDHPAEAAAEFDNVANDKAAGDFQPEALYWAGVALDKAGHKADAIQRLNKLVTQYPTHNRVANAKIRLAALKAVGGL